MIRTALLALLCGSLASAATTATWELNGSNDFLRGRMQGLALTRDGKLVLGPRLDTVYTSDQAEIWAIARARDGSIYLGTGNRGRLYRLDPSGQASLLWTADQPEIFALAVDSKGVVYAGTSPDGKIYRIENGRAAEYFAPGARYIWSLAVAPDGALIVGTGDQGKVFRVTAAGKGEVYYETGQAHITALAFDQEGRLLAGSEPNGILYRITGPQKAFVLYDANLPEIRALVPAPDGSIYAAALGGSVAKRANAAATSTTSTTTAVPSVSSSITVTDQQGALNPVPTPQASSVTSTSTSLVTSATSTIEYSGVEKSAIYRIHPDNTVETLWSSKDENVYDLAFSGNALEFLTDADGRIYRLDPDRRATLLAQTREGDSTRLLDAPGGVLVATGNLAKVLRLTTTPSGSGTFESPVHDSNTIARWGRLGWKGSGAIAFRTRTGNTARPDATWSDWSGPISDPLRAMISSPNARYLQWRAEFSSANISASLDNVTVAYLPQNTPPTIRSISVTGQSGSAKSSASSSSSSSSAAYSITVTDSGDSSSSPAGTSAQTISRGSGQQLQISWQADDTDGDRLMYSLYFRGEDETQWKLLRANISENTYLLDGDVFADGRYYFRVTATDRPSNDAEFARDTELVSSPVLIDNTPPVVTVSAPQRKGSRVDITVDAEDTGSSLRRCEYSVDANPWLPVEAADGVTDSARERFNISLDGFPPGEHLVVIRVYDTTGNAGLAKVLVR